MHPLDNVIWHALTTRQAQFAERSANARRFVPQVSPLSGFEKPSTDNYAALGALVGDGASTAVFLDHPFIERPEWEFVLGAPLVQMVCDKPAPFAASNGHAVFELGSSDSPEMLDLTAHTKPGPFGTRTHELGAYLGIRDGGKLVAMAGERLKVPGFTEISAVCTHPEHTGRSYARVLMSEIIDRIRARSETPFLHVRQDNVRAIGVYELLGFRPRKVLHFAVLRRTKQRL
ncbi:MAG: GNAT family N-acetyltransferase [Acidobacteriota bacterium]